MTCYPDRLAVGCALVFALAATVPLGGRPGAGATDIDAGAQAAAGPDRPSRDWKRVRSDRLVAVGNASEVDMRRTLTEVEIFRRALLDLFPALESKPQAPLLIVIFRDDAAFRRFKPRDNRGRRIDGVAGYFVAEPDVRYMTLSGDWRAGPYAVLRTALHEYTHDIVSRNMPRVPVWLNEGLAEFYSTLAPTARGGARRTIGRSRFEYVRLLRRQGLLPLETLMAPEALPKSNDDRGGASTFYAQSWALVHYLLLGSRERSQQLTVYVEALQQGASTTEAFHAAFRTSFEELGAELEAYVARPRLPMVVIDPPDPRTIEVQPAEPLLESEALGLQGDLLLRIGALDDAADLLARARERAPASLETRASLGLLHLSRGEYDDAVRTLGPVVAEGAEHFGSRYYLATALRRAGRHAEAVVEYRQAAALAPGAPLPWFGLSISALALGRTDEAAAATRDLQTREPGKHWFYRRAQELWRLPGHEGALVADVREFIRRDGWHDDVAKYAAFLGALACQRAGRTSDAAELLDAAARAAAPGSWPAAIAAFLHGDLTGRDLLARARNDGERTEAHAYIGLKASVAGRTPEALLRLRWVEREGLRNYPEYGLAVAELELIAAGESRTGREDDGSRQAGT